MDIKAILNVSQSKKGASTASPRNLIIKRDHKCSRASEDAPIEGKNGSLSTKQRRLRKGLPSPSVPLLPASPAVLVETTEATDSSTPDTGS